MVRDMKDNGSRTRQMVKVNSIMSTETYTKVNGYKTWQMDKAYILILMEQDMKEIGSKIYSMLLVLKHGLMDRNTKDSIRKEKNKEMVHIFGQTDPSTQELGMIIE